MDYKESYLDILRKYFDAIEDAIFFMNIVETEMKIDFSQERMIYIKELNSVKQRLKYQGIVFKSRRNYQHPEWTWKEWKESFNKSRIDEPKEERKIYIQEYYQNNKDKWREYYREKKNK